MKHDGDGVLLPQVRGIKGFIRGGDGRQGG